MELEDLQPFIFLLIMNKFDLEGVFFYVLSIIPPKFPALQAGSLPSEPPGKPHTTLRAI